jgi:tetratricopeptide (TPR) repeat protein
MDAKDVEDAFFRYEGDLLEFSERALSESRSARLHLLRAGAARIFGLAPDPLTELAAARDLPCDPVDDSLASALEVFITQGPHKAVERFVEHAKAFPDDLFGAYFRFSSLVVSGVPGNRERAMALVESDADHLGGDWRFDSLLAMVREEQRRYDEARALADRTLADQPDCAPAAHVITHVNYETGEHAAGITWLDEWSRDRTPLFYQTHFPWHNALHALALGDIEAALTRFNDQIGPAAVIDAGSLLWRCRLASAEVYDASAAAAAAAAVAPVLEAMPTAFAVFNACLALAAAGDADALASVAVRLDADARPAYADLMAPIARGLLAMVEGRTDDTVASIQPLLDDLPRLGGSDAQREVVEDTLLRAFVAAGRAEEAEPLLRARLERRPHALDCQLLAIARAI